MGEGLVGHLAVGQPNLRRPANPSAGTHSRVLSRGLGVYRRRSLVVASSRRDERIGALAVDVEPDRFWQRTMAHDRVARIAE